MSHCATISKLYDNKQLTDAEATGQYLDRLAFTPGYLAESYALLSEGVHAALRRLLDAGDAAFYGTWFSPAAPDTPPVKHVLINAETSPATITVVRRFIDPSDENYQFTVAPDHPARVAIESLRKHMDAMDATE